MYKISSSKFILIFESKTSREKLQVTGTQSRFGDKEITLIFQKRRYGPLRNGEEPIFMTLFLPEYVNDQVVRLSFSNFGKVVSVFNSRNSNLPVRKMSPTQVNLTYLNGGSQVHPT